MNQAAFLPAHLQLLYSQEQIAACTSKMAGHISAWAGSVWEESHTDILAIPVLRGGIFFFADLVRKISRSVEIAPAQAWAYETYSQGVQSGEVQVNIQNVPAKGRALLLVDDICDTGRTLQALTDKLLQAGARYVKSAVLVKRILHSRSFEPDWKGFEYKGPEWLVGYGMDDGDRWRNLPEIYVVKQSLQG